MIIGIPKEIKENENRVGLTPAGVKTLIDDKHRVLIQKDAGTGSGISNNDYKKLGAEIIDTLEDIYNQSEMIVKVKEPIPEEYNYIKSKQILFTYFHFASNFKLLEAMLNNNVTCIAYETVQTDDKYLPILAPMSEIAGKMAGQVAAQHLAINYGGIGKLIGGVTGVAPAKVVIIGGGTVGRCAALICAGQGGNVTLFDINIKKLEELSYILPKNVRLIYFNEYEFRKQIKDADVIIGAIYNIGSKPPIIITKEMLNILNPKRLIIDVCIDQGGCTQTSHPTTLSNPTFIVNEIVHYCVANMPSAFSYTATYSLANSTMKYILDLANKGLEKALREDKALSRGLNTINGKITCKPLAKLFNIKYYPQESILL